VCEQERDAKQLPSGDFDKVLMISDRDFNADGSLLFKTNSDDIPAGTPLPSALPEYFGSFIVVNGVVWPFMDVEPTRYRFRLVNACDSRVVDLALRTEDGTVVSVRQVATDQGYLYRPVGLNNVVVMPGERAELVIDFSNYAGQTLTVHNTAAYPYPGGDFTDTDPQTIGLIMQFRVKAHTKHSPVTPKLPRVLLNEPFRVQGEVVNTRQVILMETVDEFDRINPMLGTLQDGNLMWEDAVTETPRQGDVEYWDIINLTEDAHPVHLHACFFQIIGRVPIDAEAVEFGNKGSLRWTGNMEGPAANEIGRKDVVRTLPGTLTRIKVHWSLAGEFVWHCHILSHEDHNMMRPLVVTA